MIKISILLTFFTISFAYAHPNHMSYESVQHNDADQTLSLFNDSDKMTHMKEELGHSDIIPCKEQHKTVPCKKK